MSIRVVVADDQTLVRAGFRLLVDSAPDLEVVGEAVDGAQAVELARRERPEVVLMDIRMPRMDGLEATRQITADQLRGAGPDADHLRPGRVRLPGVAGRGERVPAQGHPTGRSAGRHSGGCRRRCLAGPGHYPSVDRRVCPPTPDPTPVAPAALDALTDRERQVLGLVAHGLSNSEIAERLVVSSATSKTYVSRLLAKLGARDRAQLVAIAYETGLVTPGAG
jgi:DNA-binding NarL/FixJ family response regulator